ncbi:MAG: adenosine kinase [Bacteroidales bacterium]
MKSILGIGNALTDILALLEDHSLLDEYNLPIGSMHHVDHNCSEEIWERIKKSDVQFVAGGSAANTITAAAVLGMPSAFIGKVGKDELGALYRSDLLRNGIDASLSIGSNGSGRAMVFITAPNAERTFAVYLGAAIEMGPEDLSPEQFQGYHYFHIEGYLVQNHRLLRRAVELARRAGLIISLDMASYNVVEQNRAFLKEIIEEYVDILFANETEAYAFVGKEPKEAAKELSKLCDIAVVKIGKNGSMVQQGEQFHYIEAWPAKTIDATGAGDIYAAGFLFAHSHNLSLKLCGEVGSIVAAQVVEVIGPKIDIPRWKRAKDQIRELTGLLK